MTPAAFSGTYSDLKLVKTRSVAVVHIEIPIEQATAFVAAFGMPLPGSERPVAIALLNASPGADSPPRSPDAGQQRGQPGKPRQPLHQMSRAQQAGILCNDDGFCLWLSVNHPLPDVKDAAEAVRRLCGVTSRSELSEDRVAGKKWDQLVTNFYEATGRLAEQRG